ncbi:hypothetical protein [Alteromonas gilva]|uniref:Poly(Hydroxyalkanoate) granule-associated protein n=1 Tax=Alteromonas gilva TaxID=2987522 RepID=A0ABT5L0N4_9ALTE|nr:hypothetical protein [Alteromonas gilva]MDC8830598.1 hypothetical protein [Alteromonas gilva]
MSDKKPSSPLLGWFEAGLGLMADQITEVNKQVQQKVSESQQSLDELASRGAEVENQLLKATDPNQWLELWRQSPLHHWLPSLTTPKQKRAMRLEALSAKVDLLVEQVALLAAKQAADKAAADKKAAATSTPRKTAAKATSKPAGTTRTASTKTAGKTATSTGKRAPAKPKAKPQETEPKK